MLGTHQTERADLTAQKTPTILVIGIGNYYRMDDGVGLLVARKLREQLAQDHNKTKVRVLECTGGSLELMELWAEADHVVLIDAVSSGTDPGTIFHLDAHTHPIPASLFHFSTHGFNLADTIELAKLLNKLPPELIVFGVEGSDFGTGRGLSEDVVASIDNVVQSLQHYLERELKTDKKQHSEAPYHA